MRTDDMSQLPTKLIINGQALTSAEVIAVARHFAPVTLGDEAISRIQAARAVIDKLAAEEQKVYGVTTGFGHLSKVRIKHDQLVDFNIIYCAVILRALVNHSLKRSRAR